MRFEIVGVRDVSTCQACSIELCEITIVKACPLMSIKLCEIMIVRACPRTIAESREIEELIVEYCDITGLEHGQLSGLN